MGMLKLQISVAAIDISGSQPRLHVDPEGKGAEYQKTQDFYSGPRSQNGLPKIEVPRVPQNHWF